MKHRSPSAAPRRGVLGVTAVMVAAGVLFATSAGVADGSGLRNDGDLPDIVRGEVAHLGETETRVVELQAQVDELTARVDDATVQRLQAQAEELAAPAHLAAVAGRGLEIVLDDAPDDVPVPEGVSANDRVVHQQDLQAFVNALWAGGAEAMTLMDQRVISTSAVRCVGSTLRLQGQVYSPPYVIRAIGDPEALQQALDRSGAVQLYRAYVREVGLGYQLTEQEQIPMPAFEGALELQHARVPETVES